MKASELRIGNLVQISGKTITMDSRIFHAVIHGFSGYDPEPIPLTEEWLAKFGFEPVREDNGYFRYTNGIIDLDHKFKLELFNGRPDEDDTKQYNPPLQFVHQLQNLYFALTGKELTIKREPS